MRTLATIESAPGVLTPGAEPVTVPVQVHNTSDIVQAYTVEPLGDLAGFATVDPPVLRLYPGTAGTATVTLIIPRSSQVPAGDYPFGVRIIPTESPEESVTQETTIQVAPYADTGAELIPRTSRGRRGAIHDLAVDNRGNRAMTFIVAGSDPNQGLSLEPRPPSFEVGPGEAKFASIRVKPVQGFWRGPARTHPFQVTITPESGTPVVLDGTHLQESRIPKWFWKALGALLALLLLLLALWFLLLRPTIESAAQDAVAEDVAAVEEAAGTADTAAQDAGQAAVAAQEAAGSAAEDAGKAAEAAGTAADAPKFVTIPTSERLEVKADEGATGTDSFTMAKTTSLSITDVVFENPQGDFGTLEFSVGGRTALRLALENFRSIDYHFVTPISAAAGDAVEIRVSCRNAGQPQGVKPPPNSCLASAFIGGKVSKPAP